MWHSLADRREEPRSPVFAEETPSYWAGTREGRSPYDWQDERLRLPAFAEGMELHWADRREEPPLQHGLDDRPEGLHSPAFAGRNWKLSERDSHGPAACVAVSPSPDRIAPVVESVVSSLENFHFQESIMRIASADAGVNP